MANGDNIVAQAADGSKHVFPAGTDMSVVDAAMKRYAAPSQTGAMQSTPGGPIFSSRLAQPPAAEESTLAKVGRGAALGAASGAGIAESPNPVRDTLKNLFSSWVNPSDPMATARNAPPMAMASGLVQGFGKATEAVNPMLDNFFRWLSNKTGGQQYDYKTVDPEQTAHDITQFGTQLAMLKGGKEGVEGVGGEGMRGAAREVMGEGASKSRMLADQHAHALATKDHLSTVAKSVHEDAQAAMSQVLAKVDQAHPEGAFSKADIQNKVTTAVGDLVKVPEKLPPSISRIIKVEVEKPTWENLAAQKDASAFVDRLRKGGLSDVEIRESLRNEGFSDKEIPGMMGGGEGVSDALTAEQLKQMRSDVGQELGRYGEKGVIGAGLKKTYGVLSKELRGAAANAGVERDWLQANDKYTQYASDFIRGPLKRVLGGNTASGIMEPLTGTTRQQLLDTLQKYKDAGFPIDMDTVQEEMRRYGMSKTVARLSNPTKMDLLMAGFSPKALALRQLGPRMMRGTLPFSERTPIDVIAGKGFKTIPSRQVYPTKAAAMEAAKASPALEEDAMEQARRRAPGAPPEEPTPQSAKEARDVEASKRREATSRAAIAKAAAEKAKKRKE